MNQTADELAIRNLLVHYVDGVNRCETEPASNTQGIYRPLPSKSLFKS